jgi:hypothetical protein
MADSYAGYVKRATPINWGAVAGDIVNKMDDVEKEQEAFREKYDTLASDLIKETSEYEAAKNPNLDEKLFEATVAGKDLINSMHNKLKRREISPSQMGMLKTSMSTEWAEFNNIVKNIDAGLTAAVEGVNDGVNGAGTLWAVEQYNNLTQLKNSQPIWSPSENGYANLYMQKLDNNGNPIKGGLTSTRTLKNPNNLIFRDAKLDDKVSEFQDFIKPGIPYITVGNVTTVDPKGKPEYESAANGFIVDMIGTKEKPALKQALSVLSDYGDYVPYGEGETPPANGKGILIKVGANGEYVPQITDALYDVAEQIVRDKVNLTSPYKKIVKPPSSSGKGNAVKSQEAEVVYQQATSISKGDATAINNLINQEDTISNIEVVQIGPKSKRGITIFDENGKVKDFIAFKYDDEAKGIINHDATGFLISKYVSTKPDVAAQKIEFDEGRKKAGRVASGKSTSKIDTPQVANINFEYKGPNNKKIDAIDAVYKFPSKHIKNLFEDMGVPNVSVGNIKNTSSVYTVTITDKDGKKSNYDIPKMQLDNTNYPLQNQPYNIDNVKQVIQQVIDDYYGGLAMDTPDEQMQETDVMEIDVTKYNVA